MKKSIAILLVAVLALGSVSTFALTVSDSATAIKKVATNCIKSGNMTEITDLLGSDNFANADAKQQAVILNAIKTALNTATLKKQAPAAVEALNALGNISVTKAAGGKYNITIVETDTTTGSVIKEDIPKAAVEKPTLSTNPAVNAR
ncbi:MAG: hypothetical protein IKS67_15535 [Victivallales bacterium]|nr:hypothetical protein [Victivallales bacterium]